jgi:hypothetical protein
MLALVGLYVGFEFCPGYVGWGLYQALPPTAVRAVDEVIVIGLVGALIVVMFQGAGSER